MILTIALVMVYLYCTKPKKRTEQPPPATTSETAAAPGPSASTATAATLTTEVKPEAYPTTGASLYPSQPPPQPGYPQSIAYPVKGQEPPPPYSGQPMEMKPATVVFQPQQQAANPPPGHPEPTVPYPNQTPMPAYPTNPQQAANPPHEQTVPYPNQTPMPAYPTGAYPNQPTPEGD